MLLYGPLCVVPVPTLSIEERGSPYVELSAGALGDGRRGALRERLRISARLAKCEKCRASAGQDDGAETVLEQCLFHGGEVRAALQGGRLQVIHVLRATLRPVIGQELVWVARRERGVTAVCQCSKEAWRRELPNVGRENHVERCASFLGGERLDRIDILGSMKHRPSVAECASVGEETSHVTAELARPLLELRGGSGAAAELVCL